MIDACKLKNYILFISFYFITNFQETGWMPSHIIAKDESENILGVVPLYLKRFRIYYAVHIEQHHAVSLTVFLKIFCLPTLLVGYFLISFNLFCSHSYGEFVFDHSWADAYYSFGSRYYPKFQCCVPFTPVTGPRIIIRNTSFKDQVFDVIVSALKDLTAKVLGESNHYYV